MKIRYQDGTAIEGITLSRTQHTIRIAARGRDDVMELTNIHGRWVSDDCEPVFMETGIPYKIAAEYSDENFICPRELAEHLVSLLFTGSDEDLFDERGPAGTLHAGISPLLA